MNFFFYLKKVSDDVDHEHIARLTDGFSGSDLRELCRNAALYRVRDYCKEESRLESQPDRYGDLLLSVWLMI